MILAETNWVIELIGWILKAIQILIPTFCLGLPFIVTTTILYCYITGRLPDRSPFETVIEFSLCLGYSCFCIWFAGSKLGWIPEEYRTQLEFGDLVSAGAIFIAIVFLLSLIVGGISRQMIWGILTVVGLVIATHLIGKLF